MKYVVTAISVIFFALFIWGQYSKSQYKKELNIEYMHSDLAAYKTAEITKHALGDITLGDINIYYFYEYFKDAGLNLVLKEGKGSLDYVHITPLDKSFELVIEVARFSNMSTEIFSYDSDKVVKDLLDRNLLFNQYPHLQYGVLRAIRMYNFNGSFTGATAEGFGLNSTIHDMRGTYETTHFAENVLGDLDLIVLDENYRFFFLRASRGADMLELASEPDVFYNLKLCSDLYQIIGHTIKQEPGQNLCNPFSSAVDYDPPIDPYYRDSMHGKVLDATRGLR